MKGYGYSNIDLQEPVDPFSTICKFINFLYLIILVGVASVSKTFTATAMMQLYENQIVDLHTPVFNNNL